MLILDTNVISALMTSPPDGEVQYWLNSQSSVSLYVSTITIAEIDYGLKIMPDGKRRDLLAQSFEKFIKTGFDKRILSFDRLAAEMYGSLMSDRKKIGRPMSAFDGQIAAIAKSNFFGVVTRNVKDFEGCNLEVVNPFNGN